MSIHIRAVEWPDQKAEASWRRLDTLDSRLSSASHIPACEVSTVLDGRSMGKAEAGTKLRLIFQWSQLCLHPYP
ncbi:hypothetical protein AALO_G00127630 [Alosa alosa]|uniref:Uncharacterized protein n=1 Tax=Alosa alosa TaxID=278164 RepID=A0AAV6GQI0_9TELE|nr:hypothetical protein AALO_G00127630 [Alosa alosa]